MAKKPVYKSPFPSWYPPYRAAGWWIFKWKVPDGWKDLGEVEGKFVRNEGCSNIYNYRVHTFCQATLHIGKKIDTNELFYFCPRCGITCRPTDD